ALNSLPRSRCALGSESTDLLTPLYFPDLPQRWSLFGREVRLGASPCWRFPARVCGRDQNCRRPCASGKMAAKLRPASRAERVSDAELIIDDALAAKVSKKDAE